jgi:ParB family chromosome partitioning protein
MNEYRKLSELKEWDKNPRSIKPKDFERLKKQITKLGQYKPILITPEGEVIGGNMRLKAYKDLGIEDIWVSVVNPKDEDEKLEYALSDNDRAGFYDKDLLSDLTKDYPDFNWGDYAVDLKEPTTLDDLIQSLMPVEEDDVPELGEGEPESKPGEIYELGRHRLMCGDSTKIEDVEKLMNGNKADMVFTDPPYGVDYEAKTRSIDHQRKNPLPVQNDELGKDALKDVVFPAFQNIKLSLTDGGKYYVCSPQGGELGLMMMMMMNAGIECRHMIVWKKNAPVFSMGRLDYDYQHEPILYGWIGSHKHYGAGQFKTSVWGVDRPSESKLHPTMKPVGLVVNAILNSSKENEIILDLFGGSGSTLIA